MKYAQRKRGIFRLSVSSDSLHTVSRAVKLGSEVNGFMKGYLQRKTSKAKHYEI